MASEEISPETKPEKEAEGGGKTSPPPNFLVVGEKKCWNPVEEFWMQKLSKLEEQYELHIKKLETALLEKRVHKRVLTRQGERLEQLKEEFSGKKKESAKFQKKTMDLQNELAQQTKENAKLEDKLSQLVSRYMDSDQAGKVQRAQLRKCNREMLALRKKLKQLEKEKKLLTQEVDVKESEKSHFKHRQSELWTQKAHLIKNLKAVDTERTVQTITNIKLSQNLLQVLEDANLRDKRIQLLRRELDETVQAMKKQRASIDNMLNERQTSDKKLHDAKDLMDKSNTKLDDLNAQILSLKEEVNYAEMTSAKGSQELKIVKSENRYLRSQMAELTHHLSRVQGDLKSLQSQRDRMQIELRKMKSQDVAIQNLMRQNALQKLRLNQKVSQLPPLEKPVELDDFIRTCPTKQIDGYRRKISELERRLKDLERKIEEGKRRENLYRVKFKRFSAIKEQLFWTQKAMLRLEADRQGMEQMIKSFATTMPRKIPFEKLVTDPSILDRIAKQKVLQERLAAQTTKVERMRDVIQHLRQHEERRKAEGLAGAEEIPGTLQPWQLNYWREGGTQWRAAGTETKTGYYKDYVGFLKQEIPRLRGELIHLERKKQYLRAQRATSQSRSGSVSIVDLDAEDYIPSSPDDASEESEAGEEEEDEDEGDAWEGNEEETADVL